MQARIGTKHICATVSIKKMRKKGLSSKGEWSIENITFKTLRYKGLIGDLIDHVQKLQDQELSLARNEN